MGEKLPAMWDIWDRCLAWEDPLEEGMVTYSNIFAWRIPWTEQSGRLQSMGSQRVDTTEQLSTWLKMGLFLLPQSVHVLFLFSSVLSLSRVPLFATPWTVTRKASLSVTNSRSLLKLMSIESVMPSNHLVLWCPFIFVLSIFPSIPVFPMSQFFTSHGQSIGASSSASILSVSIQDWLTLGWTGGISCSPRDSQESSPTPQFKSINSSELSFLYGSTLTSIHDYWKKP